ncbi:hypothetical protein PCE1_000398 [Barthelona sp. PCE]
MDLEHTTYEKTFYLDSYVKLCEVAKSYDSEIPEELKQMIQSIGGYSTSMGGLFQRIARVCNSISKEFRIEKKQLNVLTHLSDDSNVLKVALFDEKDRNVRDISQEISCFVVNGETEVKPGRNQSISFDMKSLSRLEVRPIVNDKLYRLKDISFDFLCLPTVFVYSQFLTSLIDYLSANGCFSIDYPGKIQMDDVLKNICEETLGTIVAPLHDICEFFFTKFTEVVISAEIVILNEPGEIVKTEVCYPFIDSTEFVPFGGLNGGQNEQLVVLEHLLRQKRTLGLNNIASDIQNDIQQLEVFINNQDGLLNSDLNNDFFSNNMSVILELLNSG